VSCLSIRHRAIAYGHIGYETPWSLPPRCINERYRGTWSCYHCVYRLTSCPSACLELCSQLSQLTPTRCLLSIRAKAPWTISSISKRPKRQYLPILREWQRRKHWSARLIYPFYHAFGLVEEEVLRRGRARSLVTDFLIGHVPSELYGCLSTALRKIHA
jgi:hypothetical protein